MFCFCYILRQSDFVSEASLEFGGPQTYCALLSAASICMNHRTWQKSSSRQKNDRSAFHIKYVAIFILVLIPCTFFS